jgi:hypothetical protein
MGQPTQTGQEVRPESPLARGKWSAPPWLIGTIAGVTLLVTLVFVVLRIRRKLRDRRADDGPVSSRGRGRTKIT